jgi:hypothetical protein
MWEGFNPQDNSMLDLLQFSLKEKLDVKQNPKTPVDIELSSVYPSRWASYQGAARAAWGRIARGTTDPRAFFVDPPKSPNARFGIWYTPENIRPPASGWDITLSYDADNWISGNYYLPFWQFGTDVFGGNREEFLGKTISVRDLTSPRIGGAGSRPKFCCAFIRNPDPVRMRAIEALREIDQVDVYGLAVGQPVKDKMSVASQYRFVMCFENDLYPGYVTEKVFHAWATGAVPIWWGLDSHRNLNVNAFVNFSEMENLQELQHSIQALYRDSKQLDEMSGEPLLEASPNVKGVINAIRRLEIPI